MKNINVMMLYLGPMSFKSTTILFIVSCMSEPKNKSNSPSYGSRSEIRSVHKTCAVENTESGDQSSINALNDALLLRFGELIYEDSVGVFCISTLYMVSSIGLFEVFVRHNGGEIKYEVAQLGRKGSKEWLRERRNEEGWVALAYLCEHSSAQQLITPRLMPRIPWLAVGF
jgi:hypothetical protein